uniref:Uncharacterized protein n=1 Tax=Anopheles atroparvus TaxID=41427 RepID=A0AAG5D342_ANOAO
MLTKAPVFCLALLRNRTPAREVGRLFLVRFGSVRKAAVADLIRFQLIAADARRASKAGSRLSASDEGDLLRPKRHCPASPGPGRYQLMARRRWNRQPQDAFNFAQRGELFICDSLRWRLVAERFQSWESEKTGQNCDDRG